MSGSMYFTDGVAIFVSSSASSTQYLFILRQYGTGEDCKCSNHSSLKLVSTSMAQVRNIAEF